MSNIWRLGSALRFVAACIDVFLDSKQTKLRLFCCVLAA